MSKKRTKPTNISFILPAIFLENPVCGNTFASEPNQGKKNLEYLQAHIQNGHKTHSTEFEAKIEEPEKTREILLQLGFKPWLTVKKNRKAFDCTDFEADLDFIEGLGCFLEIEAKRNFGSIEKTEKKCVEFLESLGIEYHPTPEKGYPELLLEKVAKKQ